MKIICTGASGFIGSRLIQRLAREGHALHVIGRNRPVASPEVAFSEWDANSGSVPEQALDGAEAIVHLAGEPVAQRWNPEVKARIRASRVKGTRAIVEAVAKRATRPHTLISASAIGFYGDRADEVLDERSGPGAGFLPDICVEWEREARAAGNLGLRVAMLRIGIVLGNEGGALQQMLPPFRLGLGGPIATGKQWMSWIHVDDLVSAIVFALGNDRVFGPINGTAPHPVQNARFAKALGEALHRPAVLPTPVFALKLILGEVAGEVLTSLRVVPRALETHGFVWAHPEIGGALKNAV